MNFYSDTDIKNLIKSSESLDDFTNKLTQLDERALDVDTLDVVEGEVIVISFPEEYSEAAVKLSRLVQSTYPNNPVVAIVNNIDVMIEYPEDAIKMLDGMKDKISSMTGVSDIKNKILDIK